MEKISLQFLCVVLFMPLLSAAAQVRTGAAIEIENTFQEEQILPGVVIEWSSTVTYQAKTVVTYMDLIYSSIAGGNLNHTPTDTMYWTVIAGATGPAGPSSGSTPSILFRQTSGSDGATGLDWGTAKSTIGSAFTACPTNCVVNYTGDQTLSSDPFVGVTNKNIKLNMFSGTLTANVDLSIPKNFSISMDNGAQISVATTKTVAINGAFDAGEYRVFTPVGTGKVNPFNPTRGFLTPKWWGAVGDDTISCSGGTDDTVAIQAAITSMEATGGNLRFPLGLFRTSGEFALSIGATQHISGSTPPSVTSQRSGICANNDGWIFNKPFVDTTGGSFILESMYLKNTHATGGCVIAGTSQTPSRIADNACEGFRGFSVKGSFGFSIEGNQVRCTSTTDPLAIGIHVGQYMSATNNSVNACYIGVGTEGTGAFIGGTRVETNHYGFRTGIAMDGVSGSQSSGLTITGARGEANDIFFLADKLYGAHISGLSNQGSTNAPSGQSEIGLLVADVNRTTLSGIELGGTESTAGCLVDATVKVSVIIQSANCSGGGMGPDWSIDGSVTGVSYYQTNAPDSIYTLRAIPTLVTVADTTDTTSFVALFESATGDLAPKTDGGLTYNAATGMFGATGFTGPLTGNASTVTNGVYTSAQYTGEFMVPVGYKSGPGLDTTTDDEDDVFINRTGVTITITAVFCRSDAGTPTVNLLRNDGSAANIFTSDMTCDPTPTGTDGTDGILTSFVSGENVIANGQAINLNVTAASTAKRATLAVTYTKAIF